MAGNEYFGPSVQGYKSEEGTVSPDMNQKAMRNMKGVMSDSQSRKPKMHSPIASKSRKKSRLGKRKG